MDEPGRSTGVISVLLLFTLAATDILIGVASIGIFWPIFAFHLLRSGTASQLRMPMTREGRALLLAVALMFGSALAIGEARATAMAYAALFAFYGFWLAGNTAEFPPDAIGKAMRAILVAYFLTSLLAWLFILAGVVELKDFLFARTYVQENTGETRPIGFSSEPSYSAFIVALSWIAMLRTGSIDMRPNGRFMFWTVLTLLSLAMLGSIYGYMLAAIILATSFFKLPTRRKLPILIGFGTLILLVSMVAGGEESRALRIVHAIASGDLDEWLVEDTSSFFRFGPFLTYLMSADFGDPHTWLGHGAGSSGYYFVDLFREHVDRNRDTVDLGFIPAFLYDYGLVAGTAFVAFLYRTTRGGHRMAMMSMVVLLLFNANFSTQLMWFAVTCALISRGPAVSPQVTRA